MSEGSKEAWAAVESVVVMSEARMRKWAVDSRAGNGGGGWRVLLMKVVSHVVETGRWWVWRR